MNIDFNRICKLAGVQSGSSRRVIRENKYNEMDEMEEMEEMEEMDEEMYEMDEEMEEGMHEKEDQDEMVEVNISELMSEIRRAKHIMSENKKRSQRAKIKKQRIQENKLKRTIAREVQNVLAEMEDHDSTWLYGKRKPRHSKKGYSNQGRTIPGVGFKR